MTKIYLLISLVILLFVNVCWCQCRWANWQGSFDRAGWSKCGSTTEYLTGFYRNSKSASDPIHLLDKGNCCNAPAPNQNRASTCQNANWWRQLDRNNEWAFCPTGYFLQGLYRTSNHNIHNIEEGRCCKPNYLPNSYLHCYTHDVSKSFDNKGWSKCDSQYYLRGFYRGGCDKLHCIDQFQCCMMYDGCKFANWWKSFDRKGWAQCDSKQYITGLWRNVNLGSRDEIYLLEEAKCCSAPAPFQNVQSTCREANWWSVLDKTNTWAVCPLGYFLRGFYRNDGAWLHHIELGKCCKPNTFPDRYEDCYTENVRISFDKRGLSQCKRQGYYLAGIYKGGCDKLFCIESFKCCRMNIDECRIKNPCLNGAVCSDQPGSYKCTCKSGYRGKNCENDVNECVNNPCKNRAACVNLKGSYRCDCKFGYIGKNCQIDINECTNNPCKNRANCVNLKGNYRCDCKAGYTGKNCETDVNECATTPCKNGAACVNLPGSYRCHCKSGFTGKKCETDVNECNKNPCNNGAACVNLKGSYRCDCKSGYFGKHCESDVDECTTTPCKNGASCINLPGSYRCDCNSGYTGKHCESDINECQNKPCKNRAACVNLPGTYRCDCTPGYTGKNCETDVDECANTPCKNRAACVNLPGSYHCNCKSGFTGSNCETDINECANKPCKNGAACINLSGTYRCNCKSGYIGKHCETDINECNNNPCKNGATCVNLPGSYRCNCTLKFRGTRCDILAAPTDQCED